MEKISFQIYEERRKLCMAESVRRDRDDDFRYEIVRHFGILSTDERIQQRQLERQHPEV